MHAAPPVRIAVGPDKAWAVLSVLLGALSGLSLSWWVLHLAGAAPAPAATAAALGALVGGGLGQRMLVLGQGELAWDGVRWGWEAGGGGAPMQVGPIVTFDLGPWLLLRLVAVEGPTITWVAVSQAAAGTAWGSWRAALYSQAVAASPDGARHET